MLRLFVAAYGSGPVSWQLD